jgi:Domain of unknown function (DUF4345)
MNARTITAIVGALTVILGVTALVYPGLIMQKVLGFAVDPGATENFVRGEVRAAYGGMFTVVGVYTVLAAMDPYLHRGRILFLAMLWLGACGGRLFGAVADGSPGLFGWLSAAFELVVGLALVVAAQTAEPPASASYAGGTGAGFGTPTSSAA